MDLSSPCSDPLWPLALQVPAGQVTYQLPPLSQSEQEVPLSTDPGEAEQVARTSNADGSRALPRSTGSRSVQDASAVTVLTTEWRNPPCAARTHMTRLPTKSWRLHQTGEITPATPCQRGVADAADRVMSSNPE